MECNADAGHMCDANDGEPCESCAAYLAESEREARRAWAAASPQERDPERYEHDLRDAGRLKDFYSAGPSPLEWLHCDAHKRRCCPVCRP